MLKLNTAYAKKVQGDVQFSSKSYHASIECELPDGLSESQIKDKIHNTFELVRASVEAEIGNVQSSGSDKKQSNGHISYPQGKRGSEKKQDTTPASTRQLNYLLDLAHDKGVKPREIMERSGVDELSLLTKSECSALIDELNGKSKVAA